MPRTYRPRELSNTHKAAINEAAENLNTGLTKVIWLADQEQDPVKKSLLYRSALFFEHAARNLEGIGAQTRPAPM